MESLKLENQICFPLYTASRIMVQAYTPLLKTLGVTYPQYLVLLVLWEEEETTVGQITKRLQLETSTITPLLKRMEQMEIIQRKRSDLDERKVMVTLTQKGVDMKQKACMIPEALMESTNFSIEELGTLHALLTKFIQQEA
ncbi:MAG: MarR family transcriptional regulator [Fluviicola sp.]|nr:MarR family transcriptional regulator [Fluviicola sp.]